MSEYEILDILSGHDILRREVDRTTFCRSCGDNLDAMKSVMLWRDFTPLAVVCCECWGVRHHEIRDQHAGAEVVIGWEFLWN